MVTLRAGTVTRRRARALLRLCASVQLLTLLWGTAACAPEGGAPVVDEAGVLTSAELVAIANVLRDAQERVGPMLGEHPAAERARADLERIARALGGTDAGHIARTAEQASRSLAAVSADSATAEAVEGVLLVLRHVHELASNRAVPEDSTS